MGAHPALVADFTCTYPAMAGLPRLDSGLVVEVRTVTMEPRANAPGALLTLAPDLAPRRDDILARLRAGAPRGELLPAGDAGFYLAPETLVPGEEAW